MEILILVVALGCGFIVKHWLGVVSGFIFYGESLKKGSVTNLNFVLNLKY